MGQGLIDNIGQSVYFGWLAYIFCNYSEAVDLRLATRRYIGGDIMPGMTLYNTKSNPKALTKDLTGGIQIQTLNPYEALSDLDGYVIVEYNANYENINYAAYDGDYYFVTDREKLIGGKLKLYMHMDVLMSYKTDIESCPMVALRSEMTTKHNAYMFFCVV